MHLNWCVHGIACMRNTVIAKHLVVSPFQRPPQTQAASADEVWQLDRNGERTIFFISHLSTLTSDILFQLRRIELSSLYNVEITYNSLGYTPQLKHSWCKDTCINHHKIDV